MSPRDRLSSEFPLLISFQQLEAKYLGATRTVSLLRPDNRPAPSVACFSARKYYRHQIGFCLISSPSLPQQLKAKYLEPLIKVRGELNGQLTAITGQGKVEQERSLKKLETFADRIITALQAADRNQAVAMQRNFSKGLGHFEQQMVQLLNTWQQMKARVAVVDPAKKVSFHSEVRFGSPLLSSQLPGGLSRFGKSQEQILWPSFFCFRRDINLPKCETIGTVL